MGSNVTRHRGGYTRDHHEALDFYVEAPPDTQPHSPIHGPNQWPSQVLVSDCQVLVSDSQVLASDRVE